jgi:hypothetical protein
MRLKLFFGLHTYICVGKMFSWWNFRAKWLLYWWINLQTHSFTCKSVKKLFPCKIIALLVDKLANSALLVNPWKNYFRAKWLLYWWINLQTHSFTCKSVKKLFPCKKLLYLWINLKTHSYTCKSVKKLFPCKIIALLVDKLANS